MEPPDLDAARRWFERAADAGNSDAMNNLGVLHEQHWEPDLDAARHWWERSADAGNAHAMYNLGRLYAELIQPPDLDAARHWYENAADAGNNAAIYNLRILSNTRRAWWRRGVQRTTKRRQG
jgi:TPR repeat protein